MAKTSINTEDTVKALKGLIKGFLDIQKESKNTTKTFTELQKALNEVGGVSANTNAQFDALEKKLKNTQKSQKSFVTQTRNLKNETKLLTAENKKLEAQLKKVNLQSKKTSKGFKGVVSGAKNLLAVFGVVAGIQLFAKIIKNTFNLIKTFDSLNFAMKSISSTSFDLASSQRFLMKISEDYGVSLLATSKRYVKFLASAKQVGLSLYDTEKIFGKITKASAILGLKTDELSGVYLALEQMLSKGKVTTEELRRQLGERLPGAMGIMAAALDVTIPKLDSMLKKGEVLSADALPKFADAVELAFGIKSIKKVDNLVAAQNRLSNAWQLFVSDIGDSEGVLSRFLTSAIKGVTNLMNLIGDGLASDKLKLQKLTLEYDEVEEAKLIKQAEDRVRISGTKIVDYTKATKDLSYEILKEGNKEKKELLNEELRLIVKKQIKQRDLVLGFEKEIAQEQINSSIKNYTALKQGYDKSIKLREEAGKELDELGALAAGAGFEEDTKNLGYREAERLKMEAILKFRGEYGDSLRSSIESANKYIDDNTDKLAKATALFDIYRKRLQESKIDVPKEEDGGTKRKVDTSDLDARIEELKTLIARLDQLRSSTGANVTDQVEYTKNILEHETEIIDLEYKKRVRIAEDAAKEEWVTKSMTDNQKIIAQEKLNQDIIKIINEGEAEKTKIYEKYFDQEQDLIVNDYKKKLTLAINDINAGKGTAKQKADAIRELKINSYNQQINDQVDFIRKQLDVLNIGGQARVDAEKEIQKLLAGIKANASTTSTEELELSLREALDLVKEFSDALFGIADAVYERKLENINAEIVAEEEKYERLIELAGEDASKKYALEKQRDDKLALLEKKRLKEEQKQAKLRKAQAVVDIAINTAIGISDALKKSFLGIPLVPVIAALGALQIASVLAQPIPQYAQGVENLGQDETAMINDGGKKEYVERNGKILSTNTKNAIVSLKKGDTVHKDYDSMVKNSIIYSAIGGGNTFSQFEFDRLSDTIESSITKGFNKAKINNRLTINNGLTNQYLNEKSRFNG